MAGGWCMGSSLAWTTSTLHWQAPGSRLWPVVGGGAWEASWLSLHCTGSHQAACCGWLLVGGTWEAQAHKCGRPLHGFKQPSCRRLWPAAGELRMGSSLRRRPLSLHCMGRHPAAGCDQLAGVAHGKLAGMDILFNARAAIRQPAVASCWNSWEGGARETRWCRRSLTTFTLHWLPLDSRLWPAAGR
jgi:hypothetical protein